MADNLLDELLASEEEFVPNFEEENEKLAPLLPEIELIYDQNIKSFVRSMLFKAEHFWTIPASLVGQHHPPDEHGVGGNVVHTKRVVRIALMLARAQERPPFECDFVIAAALLHDLTKAAEQDGQIIYDPMHPYTVDQFAAYVMRSDERYANSSQRSTVLYANDEAISQILRLVRCHMGAFSPIPETYPITGLDWIVHFADVIASQLHNVIDGEDIQEWRWSAPKPKRRRSTTKKEETPGDAPSDST